MKVDIRDASAIQALRPLEVVAYLRSRGWFREHKPGSAATWCLGTGTEQYEVFIPLDSGVRDYALRMGELLQTLAIAERRSQADIYADLLTTYADVIRIRIDDPEMSDGTLPIDAYAQIAPKVRELLVAAACSTLQCRAVWHTRKPVQAIDHVRRLRIGQSERGSYTFTVISRVGPSLETGGNRALFETDAPFERQVTQTLATSLSTLDEVSAETAISQDFRSFDQSVFKGVSANLCDAVAGLWGDDDRNRNLEFLFSWSPARPNSSGVPSHITFTSDQIPTIREASRLLKDRSPLDDFELDGAVVRLERADGQPTGKVTVIGPVDGKPHRVQLELTESLYSLAIQAHQQQQPFQCVGTLVREGRGYVLRDPRDVTIAME